MAFTLAVRRAAVQTSASLDIRSYGCPSTGMDALGRTDVVRALSDLIAPA